MPLTVFSDEYYMKQAYLEAQKALEADEIPIGAVVVCNNKIIARAHNQTEMLNDVTAHAEMLAITAAANALGAKYLDECTLYVQIFGRMHTLCHLGTLSHVRWRPLPHSHWQGCLGSQRPQERVLALWQHAAS